MRRFLTKSVEGEKDDPLEEVTPSSASNTRLSALLGDQSKQGKAPKPERLDMDTINALTLTSSNKRKETAGSSISSGDDTKINMGRGRNIKRPRSNNADVECVDGDQSNAGSGVSGGMMAGSERASATATPKSSAKMGPWTSARWGQERAISAEEGYDPLMVVHDANREIFGNESFRGVQEEVSFIFNI